VAESIAGEHVSCTRVVDLHPRVSRRRRDFWRRRHSGKRLGTLIPLPLSLSFARSFSPSLNSRAPSNRKNVITGRIKVTETTSVTRLLRRRRPDAEFKYRRKYSAFDSRNCCIRHLFPSTLPLKARSLLSPFLRAVAKGRREGRGEKQRSYPLSASLRERRPLKVYANVLKSSPVPLSCYLSKVPLKNRTLKMFGKLAEIRDLSRSRML